LFLKRAQHKLLHDGQNDRVINENGSIDDSCAVIADYFLFFVFCLFFVCCWFLLHMVGWLVCYVTLLESHKKTQEKINQAINWLHMCNKQTHKFWTNKAHQAWVIIRSLSLYQIGGTTTNNKKQCDVHLWRSWKNKQAIIKTFGKLLLLWFFFVVHHYYYHNGERCREREKQSTANASVYIQSMLHIQQVIGPTIVYPWKKNQKRFLSNVLCSNKEQQVNHLRPVGQMRVAVVGDLVGSPHP